MELQPKKTVDVTGFFGIGVIVRVPSGVTFTNQTAGFACSHPEAEGIFLPLMVKPGASELHSLQQRFRGAWEHIDDEDARIVDGILRRNGHGYITVDRSRLAESYEAWISVIIDDAKRVELNSAMSGFGKCEGILTWPNRD